MAVRSRPDVVSLNPKATGSGTLGQTQLHGCGCSSPRGGAAESPGAQVPGGLGSLGSRGCSLPQLPRGPWAPGCLRCVHAPPSRRAVSWGFPDLGCGFGNMGQRAAKSPRVGVCFGFLDSPATNTLPPQGGRSSCVGRYSLCAWHGHLCVRSPLHRAQAGLPRHAQLPKHGLAGTRSGRPAQLGGQPCRHTPPSPGKERGLCPSRASDLLKAGGSLHRRTLPGDAAPGGPRVSGGWTVDSTDREVLPVLCPLRLPRRTCVRSALPRAEHAASQG